MTGIALDCFHQVRNEVASTLEGRFNIGPGLEDRFFLDLQRVIATAAKEKKGAEQ
jgi:hypothetical protein